LNQTRQTYTCVYRAATRTRSGHVITIQPNVSDRVPLMTEPQNVKPRADLGITIPSMMTDTMVKHLVC